ncbi:MAG: lytic transglycosylase domain-containing protein [Rhodobacteraceae bacterium]|nr:lytic transglycosylase domain-containing protein [Paracoccaceae bacterium]
MAVGGAPALAQDAPELTPLAQALVAARAGDWDTAERLARGEGRVAGHVVLWHRLRDGIGAPKDYLDFIDDHSDWPGLLRMHRVGEGNLTPDLPPREVVRYFEGRRPKTGNGALRLGEALLKQGRGPEAEAVLVSAWWRLSLTASEEAEFLDAHGAILAGHHEARLDMLLWRGLSGEAARMEPLVPADWQALSEARGGLRDDVSGVDDLIEAVPDTLRNDPGLAYERFLWRAKKGRNDGAIEILAAQSESAETLGEPERWAYWRRLLARWEMREGDPARAYRLASRHYLVDGSDYADLEWLAGYIALHYLGDAERALSHFQTFRLAVGTPISLGRAGYWEGRAQDALGNTAAARAAYAFGAEHQSSFYGLLAAEQAGLTLDRALTEAERLPGWRGSDLERNTILAAATLLDEAGERNLARWFTAHLGDTLPEPLLPVLAGYWLERGDAHLALLASKAAAGRGVLLVEGYFPVVDLGEIAEGVPQELALSIARRESEFAPDLQSGAGAQGLMQLMPATAKAMAEEIGEDYSKERLTEDPAYNARLGTAYLARLLDRFDGNLPLVAASYNAGPSRSLAWIEANGDPRDPATDMVDWIEHIPFQETQNYVMRVMESVIVYRARLGLATGEITLSSELKRSSPRALATE